MASRSNMYDADNMRAEINYFSKKMLRYVEEAENLDRTNEDAEEFERLAKSRRKALDRIGALIKDWEPIGAYDLDDVINELPQTCDAARWLRSLPRKEILAIIHQKED